MYPLKVESSIPLSKDEKRMRCSDFSKSVAIWAARNHKT